MILTPGTQGALFLAVAATVTRGDKVAIVQPDYFANRKLVEFFEGEIVPVRLDYMKSDAEAGLDLGQLEEAFRQGAKVFVFSNPNNPSGVVLTEDELGGIAEIARRHDLWVISDEVYAALAFEAEHRMIAALPGMAERTVTVGSLYLPSGEVGTARQDEKYRFMDAFAGHLAALRARADGDGGGHAVVCGDWNIAHQQADLKNWRANQKAAGFLPEERAWLSAILAPDAWVDVVRDRHDRYKQYLLPTTFPKVSGPDVDSYLLGAEARVFLKPGVPVRGDDLVDLKTLQRRAGNPRMPAGRSIDRSFTEPRVVPVVLQAFAEPLLVRCQERGRSDGEDSRGTPRHPGDDPPIQTPGFDRVLERKTIGCDRAVERAAVAILEHAADSEEHRSPGAVVPQKPRPRGDPLI